MLSVELFAGAGGLGIGTTRAGFIPQRIVEWDRHCQATLRQNMSAFGKCSVDTSEHLHGDVRDVHFQDLEGRLDLISGGPPCQPFSVGGRHRAYADRRDMFPEAVRAVREAKPRAFIFENVKGLTRTTFRNYFEYIRLQLQYPNLTANLQEDWADHLRRLEQHHNSNRSECDLEYSVVTEVLNAADYGVPQKRERVFFVGFRRDVSVQWSFPTPSHSAESLYFSKISGKYFDRHRISLAERRLIISDLKRPTKLQEQDNRHPWVTLRDAISDLPDPETAPERSEHIQGHKYQPGARVYPGHTGSPLDEPAKTLKAGVHGVPGGENMLARTDGKVRYFTVRESARLQCFPDEYQFSGAWSEAMRQIGNAVPVTLAETVARSVAKALA